MDTAVHQKPDNQGPGGDRGHKHLHVKVVYASAAQPFNDPHVAPATTVGTLKAAVLTFFGLTEGPRPDGSVATYTLFYKKHALDNMNQQVGTIDPNERKLDLKLGEQITQGDAQRPIKAADVAFEDDLQEVEALEEAGRWKFEHGANQEVIVTLGSVTDSGNSYQARLAWQNYPNDAPSFKFRNPQTKSLSDPAAWPLVRGFRPGSLDACVNW